MNTEDNLDLLNVFAHDMKTPLGAVIHYADLIEQIGTLTDKQKQYLHRITANADKMLALVKDLLEFAHMESDTTLKVDTFSLIDVVQATLEMLQAQIEEKRLRVHVEMAPTLGTMRGDARRLSHVLLNLLSNAVKYNRDEGEVFFRCVEEGDVVRIVVQDTGIGIPERALKRVFEKFYRVKQPQSQPVEGTGLGLAIVKNTVEAHGGHVWVESIVNEGTTFTILLPRIQTDGTYHPINRPHAQSGEMLDAVDDATQEAHDASENDSPYH